MQSWIYCGNCYDKAPAAVRGLGALGWRYPEHGCELDRPELNGHPSLPIDERGSR